MKDVAILGLSGKKGSGKNTSANYILGMYMAQLGIVSVDQFNEKGKLDQTGHFSITQDGELWISNIDGDTAYAGVFDYFRDNKTMRKFKENRLDPYIKIYSFADLLKKSVCMDILGLTYEQCYGTDEQKNQHTHLQWENMPGVITHNVINKEDGNLLCDNAQNVNDTEYNRLNLVVHQSGQMTAREVMQYIGTNIFRKMYNNVWVDATIRQIEKDKPAIAIICDCRFPNEVEGIQKVGGKVIRFTRAPFEDTHDSETMLNEDKFDWNKFDKIIDNADLDIVDQNALVHQAISPWGMIPDAYDNEEL